VSNNAQLTGGRYLVDLWHKDAIQARFLQQIVNAINKLGFSLGANPVGDAQPPPPVQNINLKANNELLHVTLDHNAKVYRGIRYFVEISPNDQNFTRPLVVPLGPSRASHPIPLPALDDNGAQVAYYVRAYAQYPGGPPSTKTVFGGPLNPASVTLSGSTKMTLLSATGSGTAASNGQQGGQGYGKYPQSAPLPKVGSTATQGNLSGSGITPSAPGTLSMPSALFSTSGAVPITASIPGGSVNVALNSQSAGQVFASPPSSSGTPSFQPVATIFAGFLPSAPVVSTTLVNTSFGTSSPVIVLQVSVPIPSSGGPFRILVEYEFFAVSQEAVNGLDTYISDSVDSNIWGPYEMYLSASMTFSIVTPKATSISPASYAAGSGPVIIYINAVGNHSTSTWNVNSAAQAGPGVSSVKCWVIPSN